MPENMDTLALLGLWIYAVIQFGKGKAWAEKWTIYLSIGLPLILAGVPVSGSDTLIAYAESAAKLFLYGIGFWAVTKVGSQTSGK